MRTLFMLIAVAAGAVLPIQASINAEFAQRGATVFWSAAISGALTALALAAAATLILRIPPPSLSLFAAIPPWLWWGGFLGAFVLSVISWLPQRIGAAPMIVCFIAGQTLCSLVLDRFGLFGLPQQEMSAGRLLGTALIVGGVILVRFL